jgi:branched-chain amino acid transport system substrate-binding protein
MTGKIRRLAQTAAAVGILAATAGAAPPSGAPVEIYAFVALTGSNAFLGNEQGKGFEALERYVNATGGIDGRPLKFVIQDDQSNPTVSNQLFSAAQHSGPVVMGGGVVGTCNAASALIAPDGPVMYCLSSGVHPPAGSFTYSAGFSSIDQISAAMRYFNDKGLTKIAVVTSTDGTGQDADRIIDDVFKQPENAKASIVDREHFNIKDMSVAAQMSHIGASGAQAIIAWTTGTPLGTVLHGMKDAGLDLPIVTTGGNLSYPQLEAYADIVPTQLLVPGLPLVVPDDLKHGAVKSAVQACLDALAATQPKPDIGYALPWDAGLVVVSALRKLGPNATAAQVRDAIDGVHGWSGVFGTYDYQSVPQRGLDLDQVIVTRWDKSKSRFVAVTKPGGHALK